VSGPFGFIGAVPELNRVAGVFAKEFFDLYGKGSDNCLKWRDMGLDNLPGRSERICDDDDVAIIVVR